MYIARKEADLKDLRNAAKRGEITILSSSDEILARRAVDKFPVDLLTNLATSTGRDHTHYRRSGATQVLFNMMVENKVAYLIDFNRILATPAGKSRALLLGRIMQNIRIAQKAKRQVPVFILGDRSDEMLKAVARVLGARKPLTKMDLAIWKTQKLKIIKRGVKLVR